VSGATLARSPRGATGSFTIDDGRTPRRRVGQAITPDEFESLSDAALARLVPKAYRDAFPGKEGCADGYFYLHDGTAWSFYKGGFLDD
jgi:hypothetical protein